MQRDRNIVVRTCWQDLFVCTLDDRCKIQQSDAACHYSRLLCSIPLQPFRYAACQAEGAGPGGREGRMAISISESTLVAQEPCCMLSRLLLQQVSSSNVGT